MIKLNCSITFQYISLLHIIFYFQRRYIIYIKEVNIYVTTSTHKKLINQTLDSKTTLTVVMGQMRLKIRPLLLKESYHRLPTKVN